MGIRAILAWSGGKDSAMALHHLRRTGGYEVERLLTTITRNYDRVCMHGVRTALLEQQATALELPLDKIYLEKTVSQADYDAQMQAHMVRCREQGIETVVFGDLFLQDVRQYREQSLSRVGMRAVFPLWKRDTAELARAFLAAGFKAVVTCVDLQALAPSFAGRDYDEAFLADLPAAADPCGERGEFHSFVYDGPPFTKPVAFARGDTIVREDRFRYLDLTPEEAVTASA
jgi:uncharacterized protein (TIGR00290 family)